MDHEARHRAEAEAFKAMEHSFYRTACDQLDMLENHQQRCQMALALVTHVLMTEAAKAGQGMFLSVYSVICVHFSGVVAALPMALLDVKERGTKTDD